MSKRCMFMVDSDPVVCSEDGEGCRYTIVPDVCSKFTMTPPTKKTTMGLVMAAVANMCDAIDLATVRTLDDLQAEHKVWEAHNFPGQESWVSFMGIQEELGELAHAHIKAHQSIRTNEDHEAARRDACADVVIFMLGYANAHGFSLQAVLEETWSQVKQRDWQADPEGGSKPPILLAPKPDKAGQPKHELPLCDPTNLFTPTRDYCSCCVSYSDGAVPGAVHCKLGRETIASTIGACIERRGFGNCQPCEHYGSGHLTGECRAHRPGGDCPNYKPIVEQPMQNLQNLPLCDLCTHGASLGGSHTEWRCDLPGRDPVAVDARCPAFSGNPKATGCHDCYMRINGVSRCSLHRDRDEGDFCPGFKALVWEDANA